MDRPVSILIVEDEMLIGAKISVDLEELGYEVMGLVSRGEQALVQCQKNPPDVLLLDINLKGKMDGIEMAQRLKQTIDIPVVFLTANTDDDTFERAKQVDPYSFLDKPYQIRTLRRTLELVVNRINGGSSMTRPTNEDDVYMLTDRIFVRYKDQMVKVAITDIQFIKADGNYSLIHTDHRNYILTLPIKELEKHLPDTHFIRVHRSYIINLKKVTALTDSRDTVILSENARVPISRNFKQKVFGRLHLL